MKFYLDTEFLEGPQMRLFGKTKPTIDLISIGIVAENNSEYYAISKDFNLKEAWNRYDIKNTGFTDLPGINRSTEKVYWIRENVLKPIWLELEYKWYCDNINHIPSILNFTPDALHHGQYFSIGRLKKLISMYGKSNGQIAKEVEQFVWSQYTKGEHYVIDPDFYAYYADYDWVGFCWLFGCMLDLPKGFPKYCRDLKQMLDDLVDNMHAERPRVTKEKCLAELKSMKWPPLAYPIQHNEHSALDDAKWNKKLHQFLLSFKNTTKS